MPRLSSDFLSSTGLRHLIPNPNNFRIGDMSQILLASASAEPGWGRIRHQVFVFRYVEMNLLTLGTLRLPL